MATINTLLCIHREPAQLNVLEANGYKLITATNGHDGLRLFMTQPVDAIVVDYHLELLDGSTVASEIKQVKPQIPIVMLTDHLDLPDGALNSVDAVVTKSDGDPFLLAAIHFALTVKPTQCRDEKSSTPNPARLRSSPRSTRSKEPYTGPNSSVIH